MSPRTLRNWRRKTAEPKAPIGRPPHPHAVRRRALRLVRRELRRQGSGAGEGALWAALRGIVPRRLLREALARWKEHDRRREARRRAAARVRLVPAGPGVMASMDAAQCGRLHGPRGRAVKAAQVVDVVSGVTRAAAVTTVLRGQDVVVLLESLRERERDLPLVLAHDGGSENVNQDVQAWARRHRVVLLRSVPHTPQACKNTGPGSSASTARCARSAHCARTPRSHPCATRPKASRMPCAPSTNTGPAPSTASGPPPCVIARAA